jgi:TonB family protein
MITWAHAKRYAIVLHGGVMLLAMLVAWWHRPVLQPQSVVWLQATAPQKPAPVQPLAPPVPAPPVPAPPVPAPKVTPRPLHQVHPMLVPKKKLPPMLVPKKKLPPKKIVPKSNPKPVAHQQAFQRKTLSGLEQALAAEDQAMQHAGVTDAVVARYQDKIRQAIAQHWRIPAGTEPDQVCELSLTLDAAGHVLSVTVVKASGLPALDQAAIAAVWHASPLPIPRAMAKTFAHLDLTLHPDSVW